VEGVASLSQGHTTVAHCGLFTHKSVPVIFEPPCNSGWHNLVTVILPFGIKNIFQIDQEN